MFIKKLISGVLCASMLLSSVSIGYANEAENSVDVWNTSYITETATEAFKEFPMSLNKTLGKDMALSLQFQYLKNLSENDAAIVTIKDMANGSVVNSYELSSANTYIVWDDVANNKNYSVKINETINGVAKSYTGYVSTKFVEADFPADVRLGNINYDYNHGEEFSMVAMKKVGVNPECLHEEDEECNEACTTSSVLDILDKEDLNGFYSSLDSNSFYEMQMDASLDGVQNHYQGFISTYPGGDELGIFTRGYEFSLTSPLSMNAQSSTLAIPGTTYSVNGVSPDDFDFSGAVEYKRYEEWVMTDPWDDDTYVVKWTVPDTDSYRIETLGNLDTMIYRFAKLSSGAMGEGSLIRDGGTGNNAAYNCTVVEGQVMYFVIRLQTGDSGTALFRIVRTGDKPDVDGIPRFRSEVQTNMANGIYSSPVNTDCRVEFNGDINVFGYNATAGNGYLKIENTKIPLTAKVHTVSRTLGGFDMLWLEGTYGFIPDLDDNGNNIPNFNKNTNTKLQVLTAENHYIEVMQTDVINPGEEDYSYYSAKEYDFYFYDTRQKDADDLASIGGSDSVLYPVEVEDFPYVNTTRTLHRGDTDWFEIIASDGADLTAVLTQPSNGHIYGIELYEDIEIVATDPLEWVTPVNIGTITTDSATNSKTLTYENLDTEHKYYLAVTRPNSSTYSSAHPYCISINAMLANPTATLSGNVSLTHTAGTDISDLTVMKNAVMENLTCTLYGEEVSDSVAINDVELYYNGSILTASTVNSLTADEYAIVVKYKDVEATGGTVTLTVSSATVNDNIIMLPNLTECAIATSVNWDWAAAAKILADVKLKREGYEASTETIRNAIIALKNDSRNVRGDENYVILAADYFYNSVIPESEQDENGYFMYEDINITYADSTLRNAIIQGQAVVLQLTLSTNPEDVTTMRYLVLCGMNLTTQEYYVYDPFHSSLPMWVSKDILYNGGYDGISNLKFSGNIIEF